jgi:hypothetical protein
MSSCTRSSSSSFLIRAAGSTHPGIFRRGGEAGKVGIEAGRFSVGVGLHPLIEALILLVLEKFRLLRVPAFPLALSIDGERAEDRDHAGEYDAHQ